MEGAKPTPQPHPSPTPSPFCACSALPHICPTFANPPVIFSQFSHWEGVFSPVPFSHFSSFSPPSLPFSPLFARLEAAPQIEVKDLGSAVSFCSQQTGALKCGTGKYGTIDVKNAVLDNPHLRTSNRHQFWTTVGLFCRKFCLLILLVHDETEPLSKHCTSVD